MSDVSPEDRERLVDIRFGELFDRHMERRFADAFDRRLMEWAEIAGSNAPTGHQPRRATVSQPLPPSDPQQPRQRRRSLFEISLAETLGLS